MRGTAFILVLFITRVATSHNCTYVPLPDRKPPDSWLESQISYWYGDSYPLVLRNKWSTIRERLASSSYGRNVNDALSFSDVTEERVASKYNKYGLYRFKENARIVCDMLRHLQGSRPSSKIRLPVLFVDAVNSNVPVIGYTRSVNPGEEFTVLWPLPYHVTLAKRGLTDSIAYAKKINKVLYRGTASGALHYNSAVNMLTKSSRLDIVLRWKNSTWADMGISGHPDPVAKRIQSDSQLRTELLAAHAPLLPYTAQFSYKYILCVEGSDISSGFGWVLASKSVPFHPYPFLFHVWYFNGLIPYVHFVPIRPDGSDLEDAFMWCEKNALFCENIAEAGRRHMTMMLDDHYISHVKAGMLQLWDLQGGIHTRSSP